MGIEKEAVKGTAKRAVKGTTKGTVKQEIINMILSLTQCFVTKTL